MYTLKEVAKAFLKKKTGKVGHLDSTGRKLFSYDTCIAQWDDTFGLVLNKTDYPNKTISRHQELILKGDVWVFDAPLNVTNLCKYIKL
jgi:hypothetical protein